MRKVKGQNLVEFSTVGLVLLAICLAGVFFFGDSLAAFFKDNNITKTFLAGRFNKKETIQDYISGVSAIVSSGGRTINISSPVESVLSQKLRDGSFVQTSGSSGNLKETVEVLENYLAQLKTLLDSAPSGTNTADLQNAIVQYEQAINTYKSKDKTLITSTYDPVVQMVKQLDIAVDLRANGDIANQLNKALDKTLSKLPDGNYKNMLKLFTSSALALGGSLDYQFNSRLNSYIASNFANYIDVDYYDKEFKSKQTELANLKLTLQQQTAGKSTLQNTLASLQGDYTTLKDSFNSYKSSYVSTITNVINGLNLSGSYSSAVTSSIASIKNNLNTEKSNINGMSIGAGMPSDSYINSAINSLNSLKSTIPQTITTQVPREEKYCKLQGPISGYCYSWGKRTVFDDVTSTNPDYTLIENTINSLNSAKSGDRGSISSTNTALIAKQAQIDQTNASIAASDVNLATLNQQIADAEDYINRNGNATERRKRSVAKGLTSLDYSKIDQRSISELTSYINIYRNGTYSDILPDSYNGKKMCEAVHADIVGGECNLSF
ncbi:MAG: hypothetical protein WCK67_13270 [bacterium]